MGIKIIDKEGEGTLPGFGRAFEYSMWSSNSDESIYNNDDGSWLIQRGQIAPENLGNAGAFWGRSYRGIRDCNYAIGVTLVELVYVRLTLSGVGWIMGHRLFFEIANWLTVVLFLTLGVVTIIVALRQQGDKKPVLLNNKIDRFLLGVTMSGLNPAQIPFWFIWSSYLMSLHLLHPTSLEFDIFSAGCGLGTIAGLAAYMYGGNLVITKMKAGTKVLNLIMGGIFIIAALAQLYRVLFVHEALA